MDTKLKRNLVLINACISTFMATVDGSIVNISLPVISGFFSVNINQVQWVVTSYLIAISALLLIWGRISDLYGRKKLFAGGMAVFVLGSIMCGMSQSFQYLVFSRVVQAIGASIMMALAQGIVTSIFPSNERGKALGMIGMVVALGSLVGPTLGGFLINFFGWRSIFFINIPFGIGGLFLTFLVMPDNEELPEVKIFDYKGTLIFIAAILLLFISLLSMQEGNISVTIMIFMLLAALLLSAGFIFYESKTEYPLVNLDLFKNRIFSIGLFCAYLSFCSMFAYTFFMPFYLQYAFKLNVIHAGLMMSLYPITMAMVAPISGRLSDKISYRPLTILGLIINTMALALMSTLNTGSSKIFIGVLIVLLGAGGSIFQSPNNSSVMGAVPRHKLGTAGSINAFFRNIGMVSGTTIAVLIYTAVTKSGIENITTSFDSTVFLKGFKVVMLNASVMCLIAVLISLKRNSIAAK
ncbi:MAG: MFS transporter [Solirubrobacterales bacterium]